MTVSPPRSHRSETSQRVEEGVHLERVGTRTVDGQHEGHPASGSQHGAGDVGGSSNRGNEHQALPRQVPWLVG